MKSIFCLLSFLIVFKSTAYSQTPVSPSTPSKNIILGLIINSPKADFEARILPFVKKELSTCNNCEIRNLSTYDEAGNYNESALAEQIEASIGQVTILFVGWNQVKDKNTNSTTEALKKAIEKEIFVLGSAGYPKENADGASLTRTVLGENSDVIIVGELTEREKLMRRSFFGPEMLTAVRLPKELRDQEGLGPLYFASKLTYKWGTKTTQEWWTSLRNKKAQSKKLWPQAEDFFGYK